VPRQPVQPTFPQSFPQPFPQPFPQSYGPGYPAPFTLPPAAPRQRTGRIVGTAVAALVVLVGLGVGALFLFGPRTVDPLSVQHEIVRITQTAVGVAPDDVHCPTQIAAEAGGTFACTATVDQQPVTYTVRQDDDRGHLTITYDRLINVIDLQNTLAAKVGKDSDVSVNVTCGSAGRIAVVNAPGTPIACTAANAADPTDRATINVTVAADGTPSYSFA
jgi:hypothetical protein